MQADRTPIEAVAPLRISFVGGGTDFPHWYDEHGGAVLSATIDHVVRVRLTPRTDRRVSVRSLDLGHLVEYHLDEGPVDDGAMDLATAAIERLGVPGGVDVQIRSDAPPGSGAGVVAEPGVTRLGALPISLTSKLWISSTSRSSNSKCTYIGGTRSLSVGLGKHSGQSVNFTDALRLTL